MYNNIVTMNTAISMIPGNDDNNVNVAPMLLSLEEMQSIHDNYISGDNALSHLMEVINAVKDKKDIDIVDEPDHIRVISVKTTNIYLYIYANHLSVLLEHIEGQDNLNKLNEEYLHHIEHIQLPSTSNLESFLKNLIFIFNSQYQLCMGLFNKYKDNLLEQNPDDEILEFLSQNLYTSDTFASSLLSLSQQIKHHDLIDIECYKGTGLFYIYQNPDFPVVDAEILDSMDGFQSLSRFCILPTLGDNGHFLPEPGFSLVVKHGLSYFENSEINGFQIGHVRKFMKKSKRSGDFKEKKFIGPVYIESHISYEADELIDEMIIDGVPIIGYFYDSTYM